MMTYTRRATDADLDAIIAITDQAIAFLASQNSPQWQGGDGPTRSEFATAIANKIAYVLIHDGKVAGVAKLIPGPEKAYEEIDGAWQNDSQHYMTIHRVAIDGRIQGQGLAKQLLRDLIMLSIDHGFNDIRIDTHEMNTIMQHVVTTIGFTYQGMVEMPVANGERKAYQLVLS